MPSLIYYFNVIFFLYEAWSFKELRRKKDNNKTIGKKYLACIIRKKKIEWLRDNKKEKQVVLIFKRTVDA